MEVLYYIIIALIILASVGLVFLVVIQNSKGGGLVSGLQTTNMASQLIGVRKAADAAENLTWGFLIAVLALTFVANIFLSAGRDTGQQNSSGLMMKGAVESAPLQENPSQMPNLGGQGQGQQPGQGSAPAQGPAPAQGGGNAPAQQAPPAGEQ